jgi:hypothetical protein
MPNSQMPSNSTTSTVQHEQKTADFIAHPAAAARFANLSLILERELRESSSPMAAVAA